MEINRTHVKVMVKEAGAWTCEVYKLTAPLAEIILTDGMFGPVMSVKSKNYIISKADYIVLEKIIMREEPLKQKMQKKACELMARTLGVTDKKDFLINDDRFGQSAAATTVVYPTPGVNPLPLQPTITTDRTIPYQQTTTDYKVYIDSGSSDSGTIFDKVKGFLTGT